MKKSISLLIFLLSMTPVAVKAQNTVTLRFIETSDVHGAFFPYDFTERRPMPGTLARVSTYLNQQRKTFGKNLIVVDNGDILQGQPTNYYTNYVKTSLPNIAAQVINYLKYDAESFGNHDIETGHAVYDKWIKELDCPTLGANVIDTKSGKPYTEPYLMLERQGVRVAILGMLTPCIPNWLHPTLWSGMKFEEMVSCAKRWVKILREKEQADLVIGLFHSGWEGGISTADYDEDATHKIAEQIDGFDVIFYGHDHRVKRYTSANGTLCLNPANNARRIAQATITLKNLGKKPKTDQGRSWKVVSKKGEIIDVSNIDEDKDYLSHFQPTIDSIKNYINQEIGTFTSSMRSRDAFFGSAPFTDLIHRLQLEHTGADISLNAPLVFDTEVKQGPVYMSDMFKLYRFENQIYVLRMTGREIRNHLEMSYDQWVNTMQTPDDHIMLLNSSSTDDNQRSGFKNFTFNFDSAAGICYEVDVTKPDGQKVRILGFADGRPFDENATYRVAMNSYRANGGGELLTSGAGIPLDSIPQRIEYMSPRDQRYYLTELIKKEGSITPTALGNWRFVPEAWAKPAIERDRRILFK